MNKDRGHLATRGRDHQESLQTDSTPREKPSAGEEPSSGETPITRFAPEFFFFSFAGGRWWRSNTFSFFLSHFVLNLLFVTQKVLTDIGMEAKTDHNVFQ